MRPIQTIGARRMPRLAPTLVDVPLYRLLAAPIKGDPAIRRLVLETNIALYIRVALVPTLHKTPILTSEGAITAASRNVVLSLFPLIVVFPYRLEIISIIPRPTLVAPQQVTFSTRFPV